MCNRLLGYNVNRLIYFINCFSVYSLLCHMNIDIILYVVNKIPRHTYSQFMRANFLQ
jgi:hypothetical protein